MKKRGSQIPGGICGLWGTCGAAVSAGIFFSIVTSSSPMSSKTWGLGNQLTSRCLDAIGSLGGPRCCKRDSFTAVSVSIDFIQEHLGISLEKPERISCTFSSQNGQCIRPAMPLSCRWLPGVRKSIVKWRIFLIKMQRRSAEVLKTIYDSVTEQYLPLRLLG